MAVEDIDGDAIAIKGVGLNSGSLDVGGGQQPEPIRGDNSVPAIEQHAQIDRHVTRRRGDAARRASEDFRRPGHQPALAGEYLVIKKWLIAGGAAGAGIDRDHRGRLGHG